MSVLILNIHLTDGEVSNIVHDNNNCGTNVDAIDRDNIDERVLQGMVCVVYIFHDILA